MKKLLLVILDGASDLPCKKLKGHTPLEAAKTPNIDSLALIGSTGMINVISESIAPESDTAVMAILGYDPEKCYAGRGPIEALGFGVDFSPGDLAIRCNFGSINEKGELIDCRAGRISGEIAKKLCKDINRRVVLPLECSFKLVHTIGYRAVLIIKSKKRLSKAISSTHPGYYWKPGTVEMARPFGRKVRIKKIISLEKTKQAEFSALILNEFIARSHKILENHEINIERKKKGLLPANILLMRGYGTKLPKLFDITGKYGVVWSVLADMPVEKGIAELAGMNVIEVPIPTNNIKKDMEIRLKKLFSNWEDNDAFYIHLKGPDNYAHAKQPVKKKKCIEKIDKYFFHPLLERIKLKETVICVSSDHTTSSTKGVHTKDPVPVLIAGRKVKTDPVKKFGERHCRGGSLGRFKGIELMPLLMKIYKLKDWDEEI